MFTLLRIVDVVEADFCCKKSLPASSLISTGTPPLAMKMFPYHDVIKTLSTVVRIINCNNI